MPESQRSAAGSAGQHVVPSQPGFGRQLRALRLQRGRSQAELVGEQMSTAYLSRLESGQRHPTDKIVKYLAERLGVPVTAFTPAPAPAHSLSEIVAKAASAQRPADAAELIEQALHSDAGTDAGTRWHALWLLADVHTGLLQRAEARAALERLVVLSDEMDDPELRVRARNRLALCDRSLGDVAAAHTVTREALAVATADRVPVEDTARTLMTLVSVEAELGRLPDARAHADDLRDLTADLTGTLPIEALWTAATVRIRQGADADALDLLQDALRRLDSHDDLTLWLRLRLAAASLCLQTTPRRTDDAALRLAEAEPAVALIGTALHEQEFLLLSAQLAYQQGRTEAAEQACARLEPTEHLLTFRDRTRLHLLRNQLKLRRGDRDAALDDLRGLAQRAHEAANIDLEAEIWRTIADAATPASPS